MSFTEAELHEAIRSVMRGNREPMSAREIAEDITWDDNGAGLFGPCGPETDDVEEALRAMPDVEDTAEENGLDEPLFALREATR